jgi:hypothetical protein
MATHPRPGPAAPGGEARGDHAITLSEDAIEKYIRRYQVMLAARQLDTELLRRQYPAGAKIIL